MANTSVLLGVLSGSVLIFGVLGAFGGLPAREDVVRDSPKVAAWLARVDAALPPPVVVEG